MFPIRNDRISAFVDNLWIQAKNHENPFIEENFYIYKL